MTTHMHDGFFSSRSDEWETPWEFFLRLDDEFHFTLDACATASNAKCPRFYNREDDGLAQPWRGVVFMNPPYSQVRDWMAKARAEAERGATVVCLVPCRTDTQWFHDCLAQAAEIRFVQGRIQFGLDGQKGHNNPLPSVIVIFRPGDQEHRFSAMQARG